MTYADDPAGGDRANIYFTQSSDGGATWSALVVVNDDGGSNDQFQPAIAVKPNGTQLFIGFYDRRLDPSNSLLDTFGAVADIDTSTHAVTFQPNFRISDASFPEVFGVDPVVNASYMGDYDTADADNGSFYYTWGDNRDLNTTGTRNQADVRFAKIQTGMTVVSTDPADGSTVSAPPTQYVVDFSLPYDPTTVDASDFTVNGIPADGVALTDPDTLTFTFTTDPVTSQGLQTMAIAPGAVAPDPGVSTLPFLGFTGTFRYDAVLLQVDSTTPAPGGVFTLPGPFTYLVHFNEPVDPASVQTSDLVLSGLPDASVSGVSVSGDGQTATFTIDGIHDEGTLDASIAAGAITDVYGNPNAAFSASYVTDYGTAAYPVPLTSTAPLGSWIYDPVQLGLIAPAGDTDSFTISVDPGQTITVLAQADATLRPTIQLSVSGSVVATATAPAPGVDAVIQTYKVPGQIAANGPAPKTYTVTVGGAAGTTGSYTLKIILNAALETESHGGSSNDTAAGAEPRELVHRL